MKLIDKLKAFVEDNDAHAFLLNGPWGVGKTYAIDKWLEKVDKRKYKVIKLSLFGISNVNELNALALRSESFRNKFIDYLKSLDQNASAGIGAISVSLPLIGMVANLLHESHGKKQKYLFVIDDIERRDNQLTIPQIYGFVDSLPKEITKVILITNSDAKQETDDGLKGFKDKIIQYEFNYEKPTEESIKAILGNKYELPNFEGKLDIKNLRTIIHVRKILDSLKNGVCETTIKTIVLCCLSIWEEKFTKNEYLENYKAEENNIKLLVDDGIKKTIDKEIEQTVGKINNEKWSQFKSLYENVRLLNLLSEIKEEKLKDYLKIIFDSIQKDNYASIGSTKIPFREKPLKKADNRGAYVFLSSSPNKEYEIVMNYYAEMFASKEYNLLDVFRKLSQTVISNAKIIDDNSIGKRAERKVFKECRKPLASYIFNEIDKDDAKISFSSDMYYRPLPKWFLEEETLIYREYGFLFNLCFTKKERINNEEIAKLYSKIAQMNAVFDKEIIEKEKAFIKIDEIILREIQNIIKEQSVTISEEEWRHCHEIARFIYDNRTQFCFDKSIALIKKASARKGIIGYRFSVIVTSYF